VSTTLLKPCLAENSGRVDDLVERGGGGRAKVMKVKILGSLVQGAGSGGFQSVVNVLDAAQCGAWSRMGRKKFALGVGCGGCGREIAEVQGEGVRRNGGVAM